ncbi:MAG: 1-deoxy-D-xylulose-5-phosphate synthase [Fibromonadaceae bacterium]|jgi:1-deoxy-D-xylulose-5-phosphate synthase|nr:1-deoxy-D-xylulose-5-phosphate synthase [Fibromonadaceae bacterium]
MKLENINSPKDIKGAAPQELESLAAEIRVAILQQVSEHGGHLSSSLGAVELAIALHYVYNAPEDILIWDVGHQAYAHKLLTGRYGNFFTMRQRGGISGYPKMSESIYDAFGVGHASTSLSAGLGYAVGRDLAKKNNQVVAIVGDGSMTGGMVFEALNNSKQTEKNFTIVLNDNKMSISQSVGSFSKYLSKLSVKHSRSLEEFGKLLRSIPEHVGGKLKELMEGGKLAFENITSQGQFFKDLSIRYFGPFDGHNLQELIETFKGIKELPEVCLVHVLTQKGRGYELATTNPSKWHGSEPFHIEDGSIILEKPRPTLTSIFGKTLLTLAKQDKKIVGISAAMLDGCGLSILKDEPELAHRIFDVGIAEEHAVTFAAGLACEGFTPVVAIYSSFLQRAYDQIIHDVALQNLPVVFILDRAGLVGADGPTHHGALDLSYLRTIPNMVIMAPSDENEMRDMIYTATQYKYGPIALRYPRAITYTNDIRTEFSELPIGKFRTVRKGGRVLIIGVGFLLAKCLDAAGVLEKNGIEPTIIDARFVKPLDAQTYRELFKMHSIVATVEDNSITGGFGSAIAEILAEMENPPRLIRIGLPDSFVDHGEIDELREELGLSGLGIADRILSKAPTGSA